MKKATNRIAIAMWALAAVAVVNLIWFVWSSQNITEIFMAVVRSFANGVAPLVAFGVLIELVDQIRWNALPPEQRNRH